MNSKLKVTMIIALFAMCLWAVNLGAQSHMGMGNSSGQQNMGNQDQANPGAMQSYPQLGAPPLGAQAPGNPGSDQATPSTGQSGRHHHHAKGQGTTGTNASQQGKGGERMTAALVDEAQRAKQGEATVKVHVSGVKITDPDSANEQPKAGQAHIHYRLDDGPTIATTATKLDFHDLTPGDHRITIILAGNDHEPLGPEQTLTVTVPAGAAAHR